MKKLIFSAIAATFVLGGCATTADEPSASGSAMKSSQEDYVTGSRLRKSDNNENYQGSKTMTGKDYQEYKASTGRQGN